LANGQWRNIHDAPITKNNRSVLIRKSVAESACSFSGLGYFLGNGYVGKGTMRAMSDDE
jgi:hypothetical protein